MSETTSLTKTDFLRAEQKHPDELNPPCICQEALPSESPTITWMISPGVAHGSTSCTNEHALCVSGTPDALMVISNAKMLYLFEQSSKSLRVRILRCGESLKTGRARGFPRPDFDDCRLSPMADSGCRQETKTQTPANTGFGQ